GSIPVDDLSGLSWNGTRWIAVGANGAVYSSSDAQTWFAESSGTTNFLWRVAAHAGRTATAGSVGNIRTSDTQGIWISQNLSVGNGGISAVDYGGGKWVAVGINGLILNSADGAHWSVVPGIDSTLQFSKVIWVNGSWAALASGR